VIARELAVRKLPFRALNAGRSGDTVAQGRARLAEVLTLRPDILVVALGINDALRGMSVEEAERDLRLIVTSARASGTRVVLVGIDAPPSLASAHTHRFSLMYEHLAREQGVPFVPNLLAGTTADSARMFPDALHPNTAGQRQLAKNLRPTLEVMLTEIAGASNTPAGGVAKAGG
jgi:acyl-CoA thioesterase-1